MTRNRATFRSMVAARASDDALGDQIDVIAAEYTAMRTREIADTVCSAERAARLGGIDFDPDAALSDALQYAAKHGVIGEDEVDDYRARAGQDLNERGSFCAALAHEPIAAEPDLIVAYYGGADLFVMLDDGLTVHGRYTALVTPSDDPPRLVREVAQTEDALRFLDAAVAREGV